jgi:hypothetical protein
MSTEENKEVVQDQQPAEAAPDLTMADLNALRAIVDVAAQRGAFKANEMEMVGKTFNRLNAFLDAAAKNQEQAKEGSE